MAVACPTSFGSSMSLDAPFGALDRGSHTATLPSLRDAPTSAGLGTDRSWHAPPESAPVPLSSRMPQWCVDLGDEMVALHAVELYTRLATGSIPSESKVWRIGREAWTPAREVPELRYAVEDAGGPDADPMVEVRGEEDADDELLEALAFAHTD